MPDGTDLSFPVHPAAEAFAMLPDDELQTLAEDIKAKGLYHPIVLSPDGTELVDGRNRLAACAIAGVEPRFDRLPKGADPRDYIVSANINRRDLTKGQKALALALIYPEAPDKGGRGKKRSAEIAEVSATRVRQARTIISHPDLVDMVKSGSMKFDFALTQAKERETVQQNVVTYMAMLQAEAPDLAALVREEQLNLQEAWAAFQRRKSDAVLAEREQCETYFRIVAGAYHSLTALEADEFYAGLCERLGDSGFRGALIERLHPEGKLKNIGPGVAALEQILHAVFR
jgi:hypothetical protein